MVIVRSLCASSAVKYVDSYTNVDHFVRVQTPRSVVVEISKRVFINIGHARETVYVYDNILKRKQTAQ